MSVESQGELGGASRAGGLMTEAPPAFLEELRTDRPIYLAIGAYALAAAGLAISLGKTEHILPFVYLRLWLQGILPLALAALLIVEVPAAIRADPKRPLARLAAQVRARLTPRLLAGLFLFSCVAIYYGAFTTIKTLLPSLVPFSLDTWAAGIDAAVHGGHDPWRILQPLLGRHWATRLIQILYMPVWMASLFGLIFALAVSRRLAGLRPQFFWSLLVLWPLLGNLLAAAVMTGGPAYYGLLTGDAGRYGPLFSYLEFSRGAPFSSVDVQQTLWLAYSRDLPGIGSGISAFPSLHVAMATLFALLARRIHPALGAAYGLFAVVILAGSVHLGWHYAIDGYVSALGALAVWCGVGVCLRRTTRSSERPARPPYAVGKPLSLR